MLMRTDVATMLRQHHLFAALDDDQFERVARTIELIPLEHDGVLFQPGDPARRFYVVISGAVKLGLQSPSGEEKIVEIILHVALNTLTNYVNSALGTEVDFPVVAPTGAGARA